MTIQRPFCRSLILGAVIALGGCAHAPRSGEGAAAVVKPKVQVVVAREGRFADTIETTGRIGPPAGSSAKIAFAQPGIVATVDARVGDPVHAGQAVASLDRAALGAALAQAQADARAASASYGGGAIAGAGRAGAAARLALAQAKLAVLERGGPAAQSSRIGAESSARQAAIKVSADRSAIARAEQLLAAGIIAQRDLDAARAQLAADEADARASDARVFAATSDFAAALSAARADVASARSDLATAGAQRNVSGAQAASAAARLDAARVAYNNGVLVAPSDGVVLAVLKHPGEAVDPTQPVMEIGPPIGRTVTVALPADSARRVHPGDGARLRPSGGGAAVNGRVLAVVPAVDPATQLATVTISGAPAQALAGDAVGVTLTVAELRGVIVPSSAIVADPQSGENDVFIQDPHPKDGESGFHMRTVTVRAVNATSAVLASGIRPGERVAAQGAYALLAPAGG